jgi:predicted outer membrane protein
MRTTRLMILPLLFAAAAGCSEGASTDAAVEEERRLGEAEGAELAAAFETEVAPATASDASVHAKIAALTQTLNEGELVHAELALDRSDDPAVLDFAQMLLDDHHAALYQQADLMVELGLLPEPTEVTDRVHAGAVTETQRLDSARAGDFDRSFGLVQVKMHAQALVLLDTVRGWPADDRFRALLDSMTSTVEAHLDVAVALAEDQ